MKTVKFLAFTAIMTFSATAQAVINCKTWDAGSGTSCVQCNTAICCVNKDTGRKCNFDKSVAMVEATNQLIDSLKTDLRDANKEVDDVLKAKLKK